MREAFVSPTKLETFRKFIDGEFNDWFTTEKVIETIKGTQKWSAAMNFGYAYHKLIEEGGSEFYDIKRDRYVVNDKELSDSFIFTKEQASPALELRATHPFMVHEVKMYHRFFINDTKVVISMRLDGIDGNVIHDSKTSSKPVDYGIYRRSMQWRIYLLATGCKKFVYDIFEYKKLANDSEFSVRHHSWNEYSYIGMEDDIKELICGYLDFCKKQGLEKYVYLNE